MQLNTKYYRASQAVFAPIIMLIVGIFMLIPGVLLFNTSHDNFVETTAEITDIVRIGSTIDNDTYEVYVKYTVDGTEYNEPINEYSSTYRVGKEITVYYNPENPHEVRTSGIVLGLIFTGLGLILIVASVTGFVKGKSRFKEFSEQEETFMKDEIAIGEYSSEEGTEYRYYCHYDKNFLKQGYIIEDEHEYPVFEAQCQNFTLFRPATFDFVNHLTNKTETHRIGHTVTTTVNSTYSYSKFSYDGEEIWDYLHSQGIRIRTDMANNFLHQTYTFSKNGKAFAVAESCGANVHNEDGNGLLNKLGARGYYRVKTHGENNDLLFLALFAMSRTDMLIYT